MNVGRYRKLFGSLYIPRREIYTAFSYGGINYVLFFTAL